jgi:hypothetical protein
VRWKSSSDSSTGLSVAEGNCVVERRGGEQPEANDQSINKTMLNSIRPDALASRQMYGEAKNGNRPEKGEKKIRDLPPGETVSSRVGVHGVFGDRMVRSWNDMNQGSRAGKERSSWLQVGPEESYPEGDRAFVVAKKQGNTCGAKGGRKVETSNINRRVINALNVRWTQLGEERRKWQTHCWCEMAVSRLGNERQTWKQPEDSAPVSADLF